MTQEEVVTKRILEKLEDLKEKVITKETFPESPLDLKALYKIEDNLNEILNSWYY
jgi:hypothetical protein